MLLLAAPDVTRGTTIRESMSEDIRGPWGRDDE